MLLPKAKLGTILILPWIPRTPTLPHTQGPAVFSRNTPILTPYLSLTWPSVSTRQCPVRAAHCPRMPFCSLPWDLASQHLVWQELSAGQGCTSQSTFFPQHPFP